MSSLASEPGQSHFRYGPDLPFEEDLFIDPLDPTNGMRDTDGDGMPDYKEVHYTDYYPFIVSWANDQHRQNPDFNATNYLEKQFNPFVKENIPPMLLSMSVTTVTEDVYTWVGCCGVGVNVWTGWNTYADIRARIYDVGGFSSVKISGPGGTVTFSSLNNGWYNTTIDVGFWEAATEYTIKLDAKDTAGNELKYDYTVKGLFAGVLDFIKDIWDAVTSIVKAAWEAVKSAVDFIVKIILDFVADMIKQFIDMITALLSRVIETLTAFIKSVIDMYQSLLISNDKVQGGMSLMAVHTVVTSIGNMILLEQIEYTETEYVLTVDSIMKGLETTIKAITGGLSNLASMALNAAKSMVEKIAWKSLIKTVLNTALIAVATTGIAKDLGDLMANLLSKGDSNLGDVVDSFVEKLGIGVAIAEIAKDLVSALYDKFVSTSNNAIKNFWYSMMGLTFVINGLLTAKIMEALNLTGMNRVLGDIVMTGFGLVGYWIYKKQSETATGKVAQMIWGTTDLIENIAAMIGIAVPIANAVVDLALPGGEDGG